MAMEITTGIEKTKGEKKVRKKHKKLTVYIVATILGLSFIINPVHAKEAHFDRQANMGGLLEVDETAESMEEKAESKAMRMTNGKAGSQEQTATVNAFSSARASTINIGNANQLIEFAAKINNGTYSQDTNVILTSNIDMEGENWKPIDNYSGTFDGQGYTIQNLTINGSGAVGLFMYIQNATIKNVGVTGEMSGMNNVGGLVGIDLGGSTIENCWNGASISAAQENAGGIVGWLGKDNPSSLKNCYNCGPVFSGSVYAGGIVGKLGENNSSSVKDCYNYGTVFSLSNYAGGIIGIMSSGKLENCFSIGEVTNGSAVVGDYWRGTGSNCYYLNNGTLTDQNATAVTEDEFKSGKITWLLNDGKADGVWKQTIGTDGYPNFTGKTVYKWSNNIYRNDPEQIKAPTPTVTIADTTASSITVTELENKDTYGGAEYSLDGYNWQTSNVLIDLHSDTAYTVYARYKGNNNGYAQSDEGKIENISTKLANYTITIPATTVEAGNSESKAQLKPSDSFDLGYGGTATVKVKENSGVDNDGNLTLTRQNDTNNYTITSALLVNGIVLGNINKSVATFTMKNKTPISVSFAKPTEIDIPAGTYRGTITFVVSYSE